MQELLQKLRSHFFGPREGKDKAWGWLVVASGFVINMCTCGFQMTFSMVFPSILRDLKTSKGKAAFVGSLMVTMMFLLGPLVSIVGDRFGLRATVCFGAISLGISLFLTSLCNSVEFLYLAFGLLTGTSAAFVVTPCAPVVSYYFHRRARLAFGILSTGIPFASVALSPLFAYMLNVYGWRSLFRVLSVGMGVTLTISGLTFIPTLDEIRHRKDISAAGKSKKLEKYKKLLTNPRSVVLLVSLAVNALAANTYSIHIVELCLEYGISWNKASILSILMGVSSSIGRFMAGFVTTYSVLSPITMYQIGLCLFAVTCIVGSWAKSFLELAIFTIIYFIIDGATLGMQTLPVLEISGPEYFQQCWALSGGIQSIVLLLPPPIVGWLVDEFHDYRYLMYWTTWPCLATAIIMLLLQFRSLKCMGSPISGKSEIITSPVEENLIQKDVLVERETCV